MAKRCLRPGNNDLFRLGPSAWELQHPVICGIFTILKYVDAFFKVYGFEFWGKSSRGIERWFRVVNWRAPREHARPCDKDPLRWAKTLDALTQFVMLLSEILEDSNVIWAIINFPFQSNIRGKSNTVRTMSYVPYPPCYPRAIIDWR